LAAKSAIIHNIYWDFFHIHNDAYKKVTFDFQGRLLVQTSSWQLEEQFILFAKAFIPIDKYFPVTFSEYIEKSKKCQNVLHPVLGNIPGQSPGLTAQGA
jgi:hypothetical protein